MVAEANSLDRELGGTTAVRHQWDGTVLRAAGIEEVALRLGLP